MRCLKFKSYSLFWVAIFIGFQSLSAQDSLYQSGKSNGWHFRVEPYMMFPNMSGNTGIGVLPLINVDANAADILSKLQIGGMLYLEAGNGKWAISSDLLFMNLEQDLSPTFTIISGKVNAKQFGWELAAFRRVSPWLEFGVGSLVNALAMEAAINVKSPGGTVVTQTNSQSKTWIDPMLITRLSLPPGKGKLMGQLRAEIGGFGIGSDLALQVQLLAGYRFSKLFDMNIGYRVISLDYVSGDGADAFIYDMTTFGPMIRFGFNF